MKVTNRQVDVYKSIADIFLKAIITIVLLICFCIVLYFLLTSTPTWEKTAPLGAIELLMAGSFYKLTNHFFPNQNNS